MDSPSPFFEGTKLQRGWDSTSLGWFKHCARHYQYKMIEGWSSRGSGLHIFFGQIYHSAIEAFDHAKAQGASYDDCLDAAVAHALQSTWIDGRPWNSGDTAKNRDTLLRSIIWYYDQFRDDPAETVVLANGRPAVELSFRFELDFCPSGFSEPFLLSGHIDRLVTFAGDTYAMDHKTTKSTLSDHYFSQYNPDNQMSLYTLATQVIYESSVKGVIIDAAQIAVGFSRFQRGITYRTPEQLNEWLVTTKHYLLEAQRHAEENFWPMNDKGCFNCEFRRICSADPRMRQTFLESDFDRSEPWNPLKAR